MKELQLKDLSVTLHDHIDELPINLFNQANEYSLLDAQIGNTPQDVGRHLTNLINHVRSKNLDAIEEEARNMRTNLLMVLDHNNFRGLQFCCHIATIDGKPLTDYSHENLRKILSRLSDAGLTIGMVREAMEDVKKKSEGS